MCTHETIQISQDGEKMIYCADCSREFGHLTQDADALVAYVTKEHPVMVVGVNGDEARDETMTTEGVGVQLMDGTLTYATIYGCRECGWDGKCNADWQDNPEPCHS